MKVNLQKEIEELNKIVEWFESSDFDVNEAIEKYKSAEKLAKKINSDLKQLKNEVTVLEENFEKD